MNLNAYTSSRHISCYCFIQQFSCTYIQLLLLIDKMRRRRRRWSSSLLLYSAVFHYFSALSFSGVFCIYYTTTSTIVIVLLCYPVIHIENVYCYRYFRCKHSTTQRSLNKNIYCLLLYQSLSTFYLMCKFCGNEISEPVVWSEGGEVK